MGKPNTRSWGSAWRLRVHRVVLAAGASLLLAALIAVPAPAALGTSVASTWPAGHSGLTLAQAPLGLRSGVLRALNVRPPGESVPGIVPGPVSDFLGWSVALSGRTAVVGAPGVNNVAGAAYVFLRASGRWVLQSILTDPRNTPQDYFGFSVALSGSIALIGSNGPNHFSGLVYVYHRAVTRWHLETTLADPRGNSYDSFGYSVALVGSTALIGTFGGGGLPGSAYVYMRSAGRWHLQTSFTDPANVNGDDFGISVALSSSAAVIGAPGVNDGAGAAYVYQRSGTHWKLRASLADPGHSSSDAFGSVAVSGTTILVGAPGTGAAGKKPGTGAGYVYTPSRTGWALRATLAGPAGSGSRFGGSVGLSGATAVIGADHAHSNKGAVFIYARVAGRWQRQASLRSPPSFQGYFGYAVAAAGAAVVVGAVFKSFSAGAAYVYSRSGARWTGQGRLINPRNDPGAEKGAAVAISGTAAVIGAWGARDTRGAAYIYGRSGDRFSLQAALTDPNRRMFDFFGQAVAVSGSTALIGAGDAQAVYAYGRSGDRWHRQATIAGPASPSFGASVAMSGSTAVIGAPSVDMVFVYVRSGARWRKQAVLNGPGGPGDFFGEAVALSGGTIAVGASGANNDAGAAYIYARSGVKWHERAALSDPVGAPNDGFGTAVALSGGTAAIGAPGRRDYAGAVYFYSKVGSRWRLRAAASEGSKNDPAGGFGGAIAITGTGRSVIVVVGGVSVSGLALTESRCGSAFEFARPARKWRELARILDPKCSSYDEYGYAVAVSGRTALIGAPGAHGNAGVVFAQTLAAP